MLSFRTAGWSTVGLAPCLRALKAAGYTGVELSMEHPHLAPERMDARLSGELAGLLQQVGLAVTAVGYHGLDDPPSRKARLTGRAIQVAAWLTAGGAPVQTVVIGSSMALPDARENQRRMRALIPTVRTLAQRAADNGLTLALEPSPGTLLHGLDDTARILDAVGHPALRVVLDLVSVRLTEGIIAPSVYRFGRRIAAVHVADVRGQNGPRVAPGDGDLEIMAALNTLRTTGYRGPLTIDITAIEDDPEGHAGRALQGLLRVIEGRPATGTP